MNNEPTPRTDAARFCCDNPDGESKFQSIWVVTEDFARELERENAALRNHILRLLPYAHLMMRNERPLYAMADSLPHVVAEAEAALASHETKQRA